MHGPIIEKALKTWLEPLTNGVAVFCGTDSEEMPTDAQCVIASVPSVNAPFKVFGLAEVVLIAATPFHIENGLELHRTLAGLIQDAANNADATGDASLAAALLAEAELTHAGTCPRESGSDSEGGKWLASSPFALGWRAAS